MTKQLDLTKLDLMDALDLAILIEQEAMERYEELTAVMREHRTEEAASFFHFMAKAEAKHGADLLTQRTKLFGKAARRVDRSLLFDIEAPGYETVHDFMTLREALKVAMDAEVNRAAVKEMRPIPFDLQDIARLAAATAVPLLPLGLTVFSLEELVTRIVKILFCAI